MRALLSSPLARRAAALAWTALVIVLMLVPSGTVRPVSSLFGGTEITDAIGHVVLFAVLTVLWWWTLVEHLPARRALALAAGIAFVLGAGTETAQAFLPSRGASLLDYGANWLGAVTAALWIKRRL